MWIGIIVIFIIAGVISVFVVDWQVDQDIKSQQKERDLTEKRLTESLKILCEQLGIGLSYHKELGTAAGRILYYEQGGRLFIDDAKIEILEKYENEPYVLAHELGHYLSIKQRQDNSECGADNEADKLCRLILNEKEQKLLEISLRCHFHTMEVA